MPATPQEVATLQQAYEQAHSRPARALAELLLVGNVILESHELLEGRIGEAFEGFVLASLQESDVSQDDFKAALVALGTLRATLDELERLP
jgi:hypothetical protein